MINIKLIRRFFILSTLKHTIETLEKAREQIKYKKATDTITIQVSKYGLTQIITALKMSRAFDEVLDEEIEIQRKVMDEKYNKGLTKTIKLTSSDLKGGNI